LRFSRAVGVLDVAEKYAPDALRELGTRIIDNAEWLLHAIGL
jgi:hypothetical protein